MGATPTSRPGITLRGSEVEPFVFGYLSGALIVAGLIWSGVLFRGDGSKPPWWELTLIILVWPSVFIYILILALRDD